MSAAQSRRLPARVAMLIVGLFVMTVGVVLITRSDLGTPPISAVPYVLSLALPFSYGEVMIAFNALLVVVQWPVLRGRPVAAARGGHRVRCVHRRLDGAVHLA